MAGKSTYLSDRVLGHIFRTTKLTGPTTVYISLHSADPTDANLTATELPVANGYARVAVNAVDANWTTPAAAGAARFTANVGAIVFGTPTGDWISGANITHLGIYDASTAGNLLYSGALGTPRVVLATDNAPTIAAGALQIQES